MKKFAFIAFIFSFIVYFLTSAGKTPYDYFTRLSDSFLVGKYYLTDQPPWLTELIPASPAGRPAEEGKFYVVYPPLPAILSMPARLIFGDAFEQQFLAHLLGAGTVILTMLIAWKTKKDLKLLVWTGLLVGFGNIIWFLSSVGSSWYLGQVSAAFFLTAALFEGLHKKRTILIGIFLGAAYLSRIHTIISLPIFLYLTYDKDFLKKWIYIGLGILPFVAFNFWYNFIRFGTIFDKAYFILPQILNETNAPWFKDGVANISYLPNNLRAAFLTFPKFLDKFPYVQPSWAGLSIWITTPAFIYSFWSPIKENLTKFLWVVVFLISIIVGSHGGTGWAQFGYRFAVDFYPFLFLLTIKGVVKTKLKWHHWLLLSLSIMVNLWGVLWINKFGWVSF